jgi:inhibitor of cysteine peptidase
MTAKTLTVSLLVLLSTACEMQKKNLIFDSKAGSESVRVKPQDTFTVALKGNPSTGFSWNITAIDTTLIRPQGKPRYVGQSNLPGAPGTFYFAFSAVGKGASTIAFAYVRSWEKGVAPADSFTITVECR